MCSGVSRRVHARRVALGATYRRSWPVNGAPHSHSRFVWDVGLHPPGIGLLERLRVPPWLCGSHAVGRLLRLGGGRDLPPVFPCRWNVADTTDVASRPTNPLRESSRAPGGYRPPQPLGPLSSVPVISRGTLRRFPRFSTGSLPNSAPPVDRDGHVCTSPVRSRCQPFGGLCRRTGIDLTDPNVFTAATFTDFARPRS